MRATRLAAAVTIAALALPALPAQAETTQVIGESVDGRPLVARQVGDPAAPIQIVVIGQLHGDERGGRAVVRRLAESAVPAGVGVWLLTSMNPDGDRARTRTNARGVDLNRNFPRSWRAQGAGTSRWAGPQPASEPETRAVIDFLRQVRPAAVLGLHQAYDVVDITHPASRAAGRRLAAWMGERARPVGCAGRGTPASTCHGTLTQWVDHALGAVALTVELDDRVSAAEARRTAAAVLRLGRWLGR